MPEVFYEDNRIFFTSEYDRLNPSTSEKGIKEYYEFLQGKIRDLETRDFDFKSRLSCQLENANRPNFYRQPEENLMTATKYEGKSIIKNLFKKQSQNHVTPQMIATILMKDREKLKMDYRLNMSNQGKLGRRSRMIVPKKNLFKQFESEKRESSMDLN